MKTLKILLLSLCAFSAVAQNVDIPAANSVVRPGPARYRAYIKSDKTFWLQPNSGAPFQVGGGSAAVTSVNGKTGVVTLTSTDVGAADATATTAALAGKEPTITAGTTAQYWRGDKSWQTLNSAAVGLGSVTNALQLTAANNLSDLTTPATARTNLGLGTIATQNANAIAVTGGTISGLTAFSASSNGTFNAGATTTLTIGDAVFTKATGSSLSLGGSFIANGNVQAAGTGSLQVAGVSSYIGAASATASAVLALGGTARGFLMPVLTTTQRDAVSSPATGLLVYNSTTNTVDMFAGAWGSLESRRKAISTKTTTYTATVDDYAILCDATTAAFTVNLPALSTAYNSTTGRGLILVFKKMDSSVNIITIDGNGAETIDGSATQTIVTQYNSITIQASSGGWVIL